MNEKWSDTKSWWLDLLKSLLTFGIVAGVTAYIIDERNTLRDELRGKIKITLSDIENSARTLEQASKSYYGDAYDAYLEREEKEGDVTRENKPPNVRKYEDVSYGKITLVLNRVERKYPIYKSDIAEWKSANSAMHSAYKKLSGWEYFLKTKSAARSHTDKIIDGLYEMHEKCWVDYLENPHKKIQPTSCVGG